MSEEEFGPNYKEVEAIIERASRLTDDEAERLYYTHEIASPTYQMADSRVTVWIAGRTSACNAIWEAVKAIPLSARASVWSAAVATAVADLVGQHGLTQEHIDTLMKPWIEALGSDWREAVE